MLNLYVEMPACATGGIEYKSIEYNCKNMYLK